MAERSRSNSIARRKNRWSQQVTRRSNALDLEGGVFSGSDPRAIAISLKRSAEQPPSEERAIPLSDVDAHVLCESGRKAALGEAAQDARESEGRTARPVWQTAARVNEPVILRAWRRKSLTDVAQTLLSVLRPKPPGPESRGEIRHRQECLCHIDPAPRHLSDLSRGQGRETLLPRPSLSIVWGMTESSHSLRAIGEQRHGFTENHPFAKGGIGTEWRLLPYLVLSRRDDAGRAGARR